MNYSLYKPNSKVTGCAFQFKVGQSKSNEKTLYVSAIQQAGWNENTKTGSFSESMVFFFRTKYPFDLDLGSCMDASSSRSKSLVMSSYAATFFDVHHSDGFLDLGFSFCFDL